MDSGRHKQPKGSGNAGGPANPKASEALAPGKVVVDSRGRNVWHFHGEAIDSTSMMLQRLENPALALEPTRKTKQLDAGAAAGNKPAAGKTPAGKPAPGKPPAAKPSTGAAPGRKDSTRQAEPAGTSRSFEQSFKLKPGKNQGGGFDPYNRS